MTTTETRRGARAGFIAGPALAVLLFTLMISLTLSSSLGYAVSSSRHKMDSLKAHLVFEETLLRLDLGLEAASFTLNEFTVSFQEEVGEDGKSGLRLRLEEGGAIKEEVWLSAEE